MRTFRHKRFLKEAKRLIQKKRHRLDDESKSQIIECINDFAGVIDNGTREEAETSSKKLQENIDRLLPKTIGDIAKEYLQALVAAIIIALVISQFVIQPFRIPTGSMIPTLNVGDKILVSKFTYGLNIPFTNMKALAFKKPKRWDVVVFTTKNIPDASDVEKNFVKRIVGLPGETIEIRDGEIYLYDSRGENATFVPKPASLNGPARELALYTNIEPNKTSSIDLHEKRKILGVFSVDKPNHDSRIVKWKYGIKGQKIKIPPGHYFVLGDNTKDSFDSRGWGFVPFENIKGRVICKWRFKPPFGDGFVR